LFWSGEELRDDVECNSLRVAAESLVLRLVVSAGDSPVDTTLKVEELRPNRGHCSGGQVVRIRGQGWNEGMQLWCKFGSIVVTALATNDDTLECTSPPHSPGPVVVEISQNGITYTNNGEIFTYVNLDSMWGGISLAACATNPASSLTQVCRETPISYRGDHNVL